MSNKYHAFDPVIYPRLVWIAIGKEQFKDEFEGVTEFPDSAYAVVDRVVRKADDRGGIFIRFANKEAVDFSNVTHEAIHAAMMIYEYIGCNADINNQEHFCYLAGWIAKDCEDVKKDYESAN